MEQSVEFWLPDSEWHTKTHCARVLLLSLLIGHQKGLSDIYYHDLDDSLGLSEIAKAPSLNERGILLYQIFKGADALDRFRLGPNALDVNFLRTEEAHRFVDYAKYLLLKSK